MLYAIFWTTVSYLPAVFMFLGALMYVRDTATGVLPQGRAPMALGVVAIIGLCTIIMTALACKALGGHFHPLGLVFAMMSPLMVIDEI